MNINQAWLRIVAAAITLTIIIGTTSATAFATENSVANSDPTYEMNGSYYMSLQDAIDGIPSGGAATITLLKDTTENAPVHIGNASLGLSGNKTVTLGLSGHQLNIDVQNETALQVYGDSQLDLAGGGELNVNSTVIVRGNSKAIVTNVVGTADASEYSELTVLGDISSPGISAFAQDGGKLTVYGNVTATSDDRLEGSTTPCVWSRAGEIWIGGNVITYNGIGIDTWGGTVTVMGNLTAKGDSRYGVRSADSGAAIVHGDISVFGADSIGVYANRNSTAIIDGAISAANYIVFGDSDSRVEDRVITPYEFDTPTTREGYVTYSYADSVSSEGTSYVWIRGDNPTSPMVPGTDSGSGSTSVSGSSRSSSSSGRSTTTTTKTAIPASAFSWNGRTLTIDHDGISHLGIIKILWNGTETEAYNAYQGSVIIQFDEDFIAAQFPGEHTVKVEFLNHTGETIITVSGTGTGGTVGEAHDQDNNTFNPNTGGYPDNAIGSTGNPNTGDDRIIWTVLLLVILSGLVILMLRHHCVRPE